MKVSIKGVITEMIEDKELAYFDNNKRIQERKEKRIRFVIELMPVPKGRPRATLRGRHAVVYTPKETRLAEAEFIRHARRYAPEKPFEGALKVTLKFFKPKPKYIPKHVTHWIKKPDIDNLCKLILDSMDGIFYTDDSIITNLTTSKEYDDVARTEVEIEEL